MATKFDSKKFFISAVSAAGVNVLRFYPPANNFLNGIADIIAVLLFVVLGYLLFKGAADRETKTAA